MACFETGTPSESGCYCNSPPYYPTCITSDGEAFCYKPPPKCCVAADCGSATGVTCDYSGDFVLAGGGTCACTMAGTKYCATTQSCIPSALCCSYDCAVSISGSSCVSNACACPSGQKVCGSSCIPTTSCCTNGDCSSVVSGQTCSGGTCVCPAGLRVCPASLPQFPSAKCVNASLACPVSIQVLVKAAATDWTMVRVNSSTAANVTTYVTTDVNGTNVTQPVTSLVFTNYSACTGTLILRYNTSNTVVANAKVLLKWTVFKASGSTAAAAANVTTNANGKAITTSAKVLVSNSRGCKLELLNVFPPAARPELWYNKTTAPVTVKNLTWTG